MTDRLTGRVALITGGASGIGRRTAELFAAEGARIVLGDQNESFLAEAVEAIGSDRCIGTRLDVSQESEVEQFVALAQTEFGGADIAVNSAGIGTLGSIPDHPVENWRQVI